MTARARFSAALFPFAVLLAVASPAVAQPLGAEFRANTYTTSAQDVPKVATLSGGGFVVVWYSDLLDGNQYGIFGQRYSSGAAPEGGEFRINTFTTSNQRSPSVATLAAGGFVVVWASRDQDGDGLGAFGQRFDASGAPAGVEFGVNAYTSFDQDLPAVAALADGGFVVVWQSNQEDGDRLAISGRRYGSDGAPSGGVFLVNEYTTGDQGRPSVAASGAGGFVVVWQSAAQDGSGYGVLARRYASGAAPLGGEFRVNVFTSSDQEEPAVAADPSTGDFVVAWGSYVQDGGGRNIAARRFASAGTPMGGEFVVNSFTTSFQYEPAVAVGPGGEFVVAWLGDLLDGHVQGLIGRRFDASGSPLGLDFVFNAYSTNNQCDPALAFTSGGEFVAVWASFGQDGSNYTVIGRRNAAACPADATAPTVTAPSGLVTTQSLCQ